MFPYNFKNRSKFSQKTVKVREFLIILGSFIPLNSITITFYQKIECEYCFQAINLDEGNLSYTLSLRYTCRRYYLVVERENVFCTSDTTSQLVNPVQWYCNWLSLTQYRTVYVEQSLKIDILPFPSCMRTRMGSIITCILSIMCFRSV